MNNLEKLFASMEEAGIKSEPLDIENMTEDDIARLRFTWISEEESERVSKRLAHLWRKRGIYKPWMDDYPEEE